MTGKPSSTDYASRPDAPQEDHVDSPPSPPPNTKANWQGRIDDAKKAREAGRRLRRGKPETFTTPWVGQWLLTRHR